MPQLAPLNWLLAFLTTATFLLASMALLWWRQTPLFPSPSHSKSSYSLPPWHWS